MSQPRLNELSNMDLLKPFLLVLPWPVLHALKEAANGKEEQKPPGSKDSVWLMTSKWCLLPALETGIYCLRPGFFVPMFDHLYTEVREVLWKLELGLVVDLQVTTRWTLIVLERKLRSLMSSLKPQQIWLCSPCQFPLQPPSSYPCPPDADLSFLAANIFLSTFKTFSLCKLAAAVLRVLCFIS